ncbi:sugar transporter [Dipodascopsis uninucleata]
MILPKFRGKSQTIARTAFILTPSFILFGYFQSLLGGVLSFKSFYSQFPIMNTSTTTGQEKSHNSTIQGTVVAVYTLGCATGALLCNFLGQKFGRKECVFFASVVSVIGIILQVTSFNVVQLAVGRVVGGIGVGGLNAVVPVWVSECSPPKNRGKNVIILGEFICLGIAMVSWINYGFSTVGDKQYAWRIPMVIPISLPLVILITSPFFSESPRWLVRIGKRSKALAALSELANLPEDHPDIIAQYETLDRELNNSEGGDRVLGFSDLFTMGPRKILFRVFLAVMANFFAIMTGATVISYYATTLYEESLGFSNRKAHLLAAISLTWKLVPALVAFLCVDRFGRRPLFLVSGLGMGLCMMIIGGTISISDANSGASIASVFLIFFFLFFFPLGYLGANFLYISEIAPHDLRMHMSTVGTVTHWIFNFVTAEITPIAFASIGWKYYFIYGCVGILSFFVVFIIFPETKNRSLEEIEHMFQNAKNIWDVRPISMKKITLLENENSKDEIKDGFKEEIDHIE